MMKAAYTHAGRGTAHHMTQELSHVDNYHMTQELSHDMTQLLSQN